MRHSKAKKWKRQHNVILLYLNIIVINSIAFIEFEDERDAEDALFDMHAKDFEGYALRVSVSFIFVYLY